MEFDSKLSYIRLIFDRICCTGEIPSAGSECIINPIHKKGNVNDPEKSYKRNRLF